jgi:hypothetical protein
MGREEEYVEGDGGRKRRNRMARQKKNQIRDVRGLISVEKNKSEKTNSVTESRNGFILPFLCFSVKHFAQ